MIKQFRDQYSWLSNFTAVKINFDGIVYPSVEHAYMSAKNDDMSWKSSCANKQITAGQIKRESHNIVLKSNWGDIRVNVMKQCLMEKFKQEPFKSKLINTGDELIQEGNNWNDVFWGVDLETGRGENILGELIMEVRNEINKNIKI